MGPPSYTALSVEHAPWSHTQRHPGSPTALHAPTRIAARSMPTKRGKPAARLHNAHTRPMLTWPIRKPGRQPGGWPRVHTAPQLHSPARSRGLTRYIDHPAPSSGPLRALPLLDGTLTRRRPKAIPRHLAHGTDPTQHDATRLAASPAPCAKGTPARTHATCTAAGRDGCLPLLTSHWVRPRAQAVAHSRTAGTATIPPQRDQTR